MTASARSLPLSVLGRGLRIFSQKGARFLGAAVAFYALLSAAPLFVVVLHVVGAIFGRSRAESALWTSLAHWFDREAVETIRQLTERLEQREASGSVIGLFLVVYGSTRLFRALRRAVNELWDIDLEAVERARPTVKKYGVRYGGAILLALFVALIVCAIAAEKAVVLLLAAHTPSLPERLVWLADLGTSGILAFVLFTALFWFLPETHVTLAEALVSALVTTVLFAAGASLVTLYVRHKHVGDLYAGASALVVTVLWVYYSAQVFFLGACIGAAIRERQLSSLEQDRRRR